MREWYPAVALVKGDGMQILSRHDTGLPVRFHSREAALTYAIAHRIIYDESTLSGVALEDGGAFLAKAEEPR